MSRVELLPVKPREVRIVDPHDAMTYTMVSIHGEGDDEALYLYRQALGGSGAILVSLPDLETAISLLREAQRA